MPDQPHSPASATVGWGLLATGRIARSFAENLGAVPGARVAAVGSRTAATAEAFARDHGDGRTRAHATYRDLVADPEVDVVYVASPHAFHAEHTRLALEAGKPVLCEKPLTLTCAEARELVDLARERGLFLMEAMWMACHPVIRAVEEGLASGRLGTPRQIHAELGWVVGRSAPDRLLDPALGGGVLLDMGVYALTLAHRVLGPIEEARAVATLNDQGADLDVSVATRHRGGGIGALTATVSAASSRAAGIATTLGRVELPAPFHHPPYAVWTAEDGGQERIDGVEPVLGTGLGNEAAHVMWCLREGLLESPLVPHEQTLAVMGVMDRLREQIGVRYRADG